MRPKTKSQRQALRILWKRKLEPLTKNAHQTGSQSTVVVIGLGAAGRALPSCRSPAAGLKVAGIRSGNVDDSAKRNFHADEIYNNVRRLVTSVPKAQLECPTIRTEPIANRSARQALPHPMMNAIGGTSIHYWAQSWRLKAWDFRTRSEAVARYGSAAIPKGSTLEDRQR